ncbi:MAG: hypothetical protein GY793_05530 [Proteobacteria bacterium]|nr:hypothetical protein [Pseudomonadota bacterium]
MQQKKLKLQKTVEIVPASPFQFDSTFHKPDHFETPDNYYESGLKWQTFNWQNNHIGVKFENAGSIDFPKIIINIYSDKKLLDGYIESFVTEITYRYNLNYDLSDFYSQFKNDKDLKHIIDKFKGMRPAHSSNLYEYIIIGIMLQNTTVKRTISMMNNMFENFGTLLEFDGKQLFVYWNIGDLQKATEQDLRDLKLGYRAKSIKKIDDFFIQNSINEYDLRDKSLEEQKESLLTTYGVGPATVWYLLFDIFHQYDFFDYISPWEQRIYSKLFFYSDTETPVPVEKLIEHFNKFGKYRQLAVHYIWEDLWWKRKNENIAWLEKLIRV